MINVTNIIDYILYRLLTYIQNREHARQRALTIWVEYNNICYCYILTAGMCIWTTDR
jgi:hypothetical protein